MFCRRMTVWCRGVGAGVCHTVAHKTFTAYEISISVGPKGDRGDAGPPGVCVQECRDGRDGAQGPQGIQVDTGCERNTVLGTSWASWTAWTTWNSRFYREQWNANGTWLSRPCRTSWTSRNSRFAEGFKGIGCSGPRGEPGLPGRNFEGLTENDIERIVRHPALKVCPDEPPLQNDFRVKRATEEMAAAIPHPLSRSHLIPENFLPTTRMSTRTQSKALKVIEEILDAMALVEYGSTPPLWNCSPREVRLPSVLWPSPPRRNSSTSK